MGKYKLREPIEAEETKDEKCMAITDPHLMMSVMTKEDFDVLFEPLNLLPDDPKLTWTDEELKKYVDDSIKEHLAGSEVRINSKLSHLR